MKAVPILLLPGMDGSGDLFDPFVREAPSGFHPIVVRLPQSGSYDELMPSLRERVPNEPFVVLGESYSGPLALRIGRQREVPAVAVVLCNSFVAPPRTPLLRALPWTVLLSTTPPAWIVRRLMAGRNASPALVSAIQTAITRTPARVLADRMRAVLNLDDEATLAAVNVPILSLRGTQDWLVPESAVKNIERIAPHVVRRDIAAPHFLLQTAPREAWAAITEFLSQLPQLARP